MKDLNDSKTDELLTMLEELQDENEELQEQTSKMQQMISRLLSANSALKNEIQKKSATIVSLNGQIEKLSESDLVLKRNEQLEKENRELQISEQNARQEAESMISAVKAEYAQLDKRFKEREQAVLQRERQAEAAEKIMKNTIRQRATEMIKKQKRGLQHHYNQRRKAYSTMVFFAMFYGILVTLLTAIKTDILVEDTAAFFASIGYGITSIWEWTVSLADMLAGISKLIPLPLVDWVVYWIIRISIVLPVVGVVCMMVFMAGRRYLEFLGKNQADEITVFAGLIDLAVIVFLADEIKRLISVNLLLLFVGLFVIYTIVRDVFQTEKRVVIAQ